MEWNGCFLGVNARPLSWSKLERLLSGRYDGHLQPEPAQSSPNAAHVRQSDGRIADLHCRSSYSFLHGASEPEELVARAVELGYRALGLCDRDGLYGVVKFAEAAAHYQLDTIIGAELSVGEQLGIPATLCVLAKDVEGYRRLSRVISAAAMAAGEKDHTVYPSLAALGTAAGGRWYVLVDATWAPQLPALIEAFGRENIRLEYRISRRPTDADAHAELDRLRAQYQLRGTVSAVATAATMGARRLAAAKDALAARRSVGDHAAELDPMGGRWLLGEKALATMVPHASELMAENLRLAEECAVQLTLVAPNLPSHGDNELAQLRQLVAERAPQRYSSRPTEIAHRAHAQIDYELEVIEQLGFAGYFLIVCGIVDFCRRENILCQGRGSAANSAVVFALGITNVEPISARLLFERFLSPEREGPPDIDIDIESGRREEVIQYVYDTYGRDYAAMVANVITYRHKGAIRDAGRALGFAQGSCDAWSRGIADPPEQVRQLAASLEGQPRHLGIHSGGMVLCDRPIADVVPVEWARMDKRSVVQWDKDDCASAGLVKFDLLGLGMLEALHHMIDLVAEQHGITVHLWELDLAEPEVYAMLARADAVGVFQVESRAQLNTLPRLKPREFFDLVVEVALVRPGPIQGGSVHPYIRRRNGLEPVEFDHPCLENALGKTLGVPLFQEQLMQIAVDAAGFSGVEADALRRAMGSKRSPERMETLRAKFYAGCKSTHNIDEDTAHRLWLKIMAFAAYGFPESHSQSFASLVYFSAWFKYHYPAEFCVGLLRAQPMGFYSPQSLIQDARRHGVQVEPVSVLDSDVQPRVDNGAIRLGLCSVSGLRRQAADRLEKIRHSLSPASTVADIARVAELNVRDVESLGRAGAFAALGISRRQTQWVAGVAASEQQGMLPGLSAITAPPLPGMNTFELMVADVASTGITPANQPLELIRAELERRGVIPAAQLLAQEDGRRILVAGIITHRQRPQTASGAVFFGMEDETGLINVVVSPGLWARYRRLARTATALLVRGIVRTATGAATVEADKFEPLALGEMLDIRSRDFR
ncbi:error-prone DNA polymerase [Corynebacterium sp. 11A]|uniref:error-prone DNA polymerase n=1 Tax=Corynebacterium sp. 11A TaxID=2080510 RepID=UPI00124ECDE7|nr:error-prone DNA polymerase [Corynebacterium sp. 11A]